MFNRQRLKWARKRKGYTQEELARVINTTKGTVSNYENGHSAPHDEMLVKIADALEVSIDFLMNRTDNPDGMAWDKRSKEEIKELRDLFVNSDEPLAIDGDLVTEEEREYFYELLRVAKRRAQKTQEAVKVTEDTEGYDSNGTNAK